MGEKKIALVGCGKHAEKIAREANKWKGKAKIACVVDPARQHRDSFARCHVPEALQFDMPSDIKSLDFDAAIIAGSPASNVDAAAYFLQGGKHVYVEKPISIWPHDVQLLSDLADKKNLIFMTGVNRVVYPAYRAAAAAFRNGAIGEAESFLFYYRRNWEQIARQSHWRADILGLTGGGIHADHSPHYLTFLFSSLNFMPLGLRYLDAKFAPDNKFQDVMSLAAGVCYEIEDAEGRQAVVYLDGLSSEKAEDERIKIYGRSGTIEIRFEDGSSNSYISNGKETKIDTKNAEAEIRAMGIDDARASHPALVHNFIAQLLGNTSVNACPGSSAILPAQVMEPIRTCLFYDGILRCAKDASAYGNLGMTEPERIEYPQRLRTDMESFGNALDPFTARYKMLDVRPMSADELRQPLLEKLYTNSVIG